MMQIDMFGSAVMVGPTVRINDPQSFGSAIYIRARSGNDFAEVAVARHDNGSWRYGLFCRCDAHSLQQNIDSRSFESETTDEAMSSALCAVARAIDGKAGCMALLIALRHEVMESGMYGAIAGVPCAQDMTDPSVEVDDD